MGLTDRYMCKFALGKLAYENDHAVWRRVCFSENMDLNSSIRELLVEVREQKREISSLKEVRGNSLSVRSEVKTVKTEHELK
ncbi:hypothetical protein DPMN_088996 [Dreissena polymorpha]|uniref:Uncharacterized protein n=1 Tax=Dreissena polymorpha TaxID=45954 RepID=A0A9D4KW40_DREPO|nr:hypothetical protein DPMN_088996 [Dreissena polymorpha]